MFKAVIAKLNEPFPESHTGKKNYIGTIYIGGFVAAFLYFFNPFGLQNMPLGLGVSSIIFGFISTFCSASFSLFVGFVLKAKTDEPSWSLWKWLLLSMCLVAWVAVGNFTYLLFSLPESFEWSNYPLMLKQTFMVGIVPLVVSGMLIQMRATSQNQKEAQSVTALKNDRARLNNNNATDIEFEMSDGHVLALNTVQICAIEAMQNYLMIYHWDNESNALQQDIIRCTMAKATELVCATSLLRCHRSYIVNLHRVTNINGNAQGLRLAVDGITEKDIPVSRTYIKAFKTSMSECK
jgi:DNA-binding LytR/AlgR family response regulator